MVKFSNRHNTWIRYALTMYANECKNFLYSSNSASNFQGFFFFCAKTLYTYIVHREFSDPFYYRITHPRKNATQRRKLFKFLSENLRRTEKKKRNFDKSHLNCTVGVYSAAQLCTIKLNVFSWLIQSAFFLLGRLLF